MTIFSLIFLSVLNIVAYYTKLKLTTPGRIGVDSVEKKTDINHQVDGGFKHCFLKAF